MFINSVPRDFWQTLGQYVYGYMKNNAWLYIGKGNGNRAINHIQDKGYDIDDLYIIAKNLERFEDKTDSQSFLLESFLITTTTPADNRVSGHYKECFIMAKFSELFNVYKASQNDNFETLPEWYVENYSKLKGRINVVEIKSDQIILTFATREQIMPSLWVSASSEVKNFRFQIQTDGDKLEFRKNQLFAFLESFDISVNDINKIGNREIYEVSHDIDVEKAVNIIDDFFG